MGIGLGDYPAPVAERYDVLINRSTDTLLDTRNVCCIVTENSVAVEVTFPAVPRFEQLATVADGDGHCATYNITVNGNGKLLNGEATVVMNVNRMSLTWIYNGTKWVMV